MLGQAKDVDICLIFDTFLSAHEGFINSRDGILLLKLSEQDKLKSYLSPLCKDSYPSARGPRREENVHRLRHTHARLHIRRRSRQQQRSLPSVTGQCLSEHNTHTAPWQQALPASCSHCVMRQSEEINLAAMLQSRAETKTCIKCMDVFLKHHGKYWHKCNPY